MDQSDHLMDTPPPSYDEVIKADNEDIEAEMIDYDPSRSAY